MDPKYESMIVKTALLVKRLPERSSNCLQQEFEIFNFSMGSCNHRRTWTTEFGGAAPCCPKKIFKKVIKKLIFISKK